MLVLAALLVAFVRCAAVLTREARLMSDAVLVAQPVSGANDATGPLLDIVPVLPGAALQGATDLSGAAGVTGVVGIEARGDADQVAAAYRRAMERNGWTFKGSEQELGGYLFEQQSEQLVALVIFREVVPGTTSIVVQVQ